MRSADTRTDSLVAPIHPTPIRQEGAQHLMFGADHEAVQQGRVATVQALSGTGALRIGFEFLRYVLSANLMC